MYQANALKKHMNVTKLKMVLIMLGLNHYLESKSIFLGFEKTELNLNIICWYLTLIRQLII